MGNFNSKSKMLKSKVYEISDESSDDAIEQNEQEDGDQEGDLEMFEDDNSQE